MRYQPSLCKFSCLKRSRRRAVICDCSLHGETCTQAVLLQLTISAVVIAFFAVTTIATKTTLSSLWQVIVKAYNDTKDPNYVERQDTLFGVLRGWRDFSGHK